MLPPPQAQLLLLTLLLAIISQHSVTTAAPRIPRRRRQLVGAAAASGNPAATASPLLRSTPPAEGSSVGGPVTARAMRMPVRTVLKADDSEAAGQLELVWVSQDGARAGEAVMVVGWGSLFPNASVACDGEALRTIGHSNSAIMALLPLDLKEGRHDIGLRAGSVQSTATLGLGDAEVWWCQGDEGPNATQLGWVRCFGRAVGAKRTSDPAPINLRAEIEALLAAGPAVSAQQLHELAERHDNTIAARRWSAPTLLLTSTADKHPPLRLVAVPGSVPGS